MEAALLNALGKDDRLLIISNGQFGERFSAIAQAHEINSDIIEAPWGEEVPLQKIQDKLSSGNFQAVAVVHNESSTGVVNDLEGIGKIVAQTDAILIVDSVSGLGGIQMLQDAWGVDILVSASQKALMCPPGLGIASVSDKGWKKLERNTNRTLFYWDFLKARKSAENNQTVFTAPVTLISALHEALEMMYDEGVENVLKRHQRLADALRAGGNAIGLDTFPQSTINSNTVTVFTMPYELDGNTVVKHMYEQYNTVIAGARNWLSGKVIRFGTMGTISEEDILMDLEYLEETLNHLNYPVTKGLGVNTARQALTLNKKKSE